MRKLNPKLTDWKVSLKKLEIGLLTISVPAVSRHLGTVKGWRYKRLEIAIALRKQGWTYAKIADHLFMTPKTIMRDIKCLAIKSHCSKKYKFHSNFEQQWSIKNCIDQISALCLIFNGNYFIARLMIMARTWLLEPVRTECYKRWLVHVDEKFAWSMHA